MPVSSAPSFSSYTPSEASVEQEQQKQPKKKLKWHRKFAYQKFAGYRPVLTARAAEFYFLACTVICVALGVPILIASLNVVEYRVPYAFAPPFDGLTSAQRQQRLLDAGDAGVVQELNITIDKDMEPPIYVVFSLGSYFQNYRRYVRSIDATLMHDGGNTSTPSSACQPYSFIGDPASNPGPNSSLYANGAINPCGQIAQSFFNDTYDVLLTEGGATQTLDIDQSSIAWSNDDKLYGDFIPYNFNSDPAFRGGGTVNQPLNTDQHWMVWMRTGAKTVVEKLYGQINTPLPANSSIQLRIRNRYNTYDFDGAKEIILTTNSWVGGRNLFLGAFYLALAGACALTGLYFLLAYNAGLVWKRAPGRLADLSWVRDQPDELVRASSVADLELRFNQSANTDKRAAAATGTLQAATAEPQISAYQSSGAVVTDGSDGAAGSAADGMHPAAVAAEGEPRNGGPPF